jgi:hypothetical protein
MLQNVQNVIKVKHLWLGKFVTRVMLDVSVVQKVFAVHVWLAVINRTKV